jgi:hypothetical protein
VSRWRLDEVGVEYCVPDGVAGPQADPLGDRTVLLLGTSKLLLGAEGLLGLQVLLDHLGRRCPGGGCVRTGIVTACVGCRKCCRWVRREY